MKANWKYILMWTAIGLFVVFAAINTGWSIYAFAKYGGKPIEEVPMWAAYYMFRFWR